VKGILITGANSYIGTSLERYLSQWPEEYHVDTVDMVDGSWREKSFGGYDAVFHVAGIAHSDTGNAGEEEQARYYAINTELAIETAKKAKADGVKQFIFMSSMIVYGDSAPIGVERVITKDTIPAPANFYGDSKLKAEEGIRPLSDDAFKVAILRPPMIYGPGCKGNYVTLTKLALKLPVFPDIENRRSMLYIGNLCEFLRQIITDEAAGLFFPQNREYVCTSEMVRMIAEAHGKRIRLTKLFNPIIRLLGKRVPLVNKAFGNLAYDMGMSGYAGEYRVYESIKESE